jgi:thioredoxin 1
MKVVEVNVTNFVELVLNSEKPVLVDFWAPWCGPCKMIAPVLDVLADETDSVLIAKINIDENQSLAVEYFIRSIPALVLFKDGKVDKKLLGVQPIDNLRQFIQ